MSKVGVTLLALCFRCIRLCLGVVHVFAHVFTAIHHVDTKGFCWVKVIWNPRASTMLTRSKRQRNKEQSAAVDAASDASIRTHLDQSRSPSREPCTKSMRNDHFQSSGSSSGSAGNSSSSPRSPSSSPSNPSASNQSASNQSASNPSASNPSASVDSDAPIPIAAPITTSP